MNVDQRGHRRERRRREHRRVPDHPRPDQGVGLQRPERHAGGRPPHRRSRAPTGSRSSTVTETLTPRRRRSRPGRPRSCATSSGRCTRPPIDERRRRTRAHAAPRRRRPGGRTILSHVELTVQRGEFIAVLGPNGAGKSTLMKALLGLVPLRDGDITVLGESPAAARPRVGYVPQRHGFDDHTRDPRRRPRPPRSRRRPLGRPGRAHRAAAASAAAPSTPASTTSSRLVGARGYAHRPIGELSGGEQQRLLLAQALVRRPELLILDEPLDSLDLPNQAAVAALVKRICTPGARRRAARRARRQPARSATSTGSSTWRMAARCADRSTR